MTDKYAVLIVCEHVTFTLFGLLVVYEYYSNMSRVIQLASLSNLHCFDMRALLELRN